MTIPIRSTAHEEMEYPAPSDYMADDPALPPVHAEAIAALREMADWLAAHPDVPTPTSIDLHAHLHGPVEANLDLMAAFAVAHGGVRKQNGSTVWAERTWTGTEQIQVVYRVTATLPGAGL